jgi:hypothetical protein
MEDGRLSGTVTAEQGNDLAAADVDIQAGSYRDAGVAHTQPAGDDNVTGEIC